MKSKYIFRIDDVCENMNWDNFFKVKSIFIENNIKPIIGVIPNNKDENLLKYPKCNFDFWNEIYRLQNSLEWSVALHGYTHVFESENAGILGINNRSEFAGLSKNEQNEKIKKGIKIFNDNNIRIDAFMAPAHSFDKITIECLKENGINVVTDGYSLYPYYKYGILFVPQLLAKPRKMPFGIYTWCLHTNTMSDKNIEEIYEFVNKNKDDIISFPEAIKYVISNINYKIQNLLLKNTMNFVRKLRKTNNL